MSEACFDWIQKWAYGLTFAITQSESSSEQIIGQAMAGILTGNYSNLGYQDPRLRFPRIVWDLAIKQPYVGFAVS